MKRRRGRFAMQTLGQISNFLTDNFVDGQLDHQRVSVVLSTDLPRIINELSDTVTALENCWKLRSDYIEQKSILNDELANTQQEKLLSLLAIASSEDPLVRAYNIDFTSDDVKEKVNQVKLKLSGNYSNLKLVTALEKCKGDLQSVAQQVRLMIGGDIRYHAIKELIHERFIREQQRQEEAKIRRGSPGTVSDELCQEADKGSCKMGILHTFFRSIHGVTKKIYL
jgi:hypothetical protein